VISTSVTFKETVKSKNKKKNKQKNKKTKQKIKNKNTKIRKERVRLQSSDLNLIFK
jgi:hypothetical protein